MASSCAHSLCAPSPGAHICTHHHTSFAGHSRSTVTNAAPGLLRRSMALRCRHPEGVHLERQNWKLAHASLPPVTPARDTRDTPP